MYENFFSLKSIKLFANIIPSISNEWKLFYDMFCLGYFYYENKLIIMDTEAPFESTRLNIYS